MRTNQTTGQASRTLCTQAREWVKLGLGLVAGVAFIWSSVFNGNGSILLLSFCLILLGCATPLMLLLDRLPNLFNRAKSTSRTSARREIPAKPPALDGSPRRTFPVCVDSPNSPVHSPVT